MLGLCPISLCRDACVVRQLKRNTPPAKKSGTWIAGQGKKKKCAKGESNPRHSYILAWQSCILPLNHWRIRFPFLQFSAYVYSGVMGSEAREPAGGARMSPVLNPVPYRRSRDATATRSSRSLPRTPGVPGRSHAAQVARTQRRQMQRYGSWKPHLLPRVSGPPRRWRLVTRGLST